jgi:hypothetical protein
MIRLRIGATKKARIQGAVVPTATKREQNHNHSEEDHLDLMIVPQDAVNQNVVGISTLKQWDTSRADLEEQVDSRRAQIK